MSSKLGQWKRGDIGPDGRIFFRYKFTVRNGKKWGPHEIWMSHRKFKEAVQDVLTRTHESRIKNQGKRINRAILYTANGKGERLKCAILKMIERGKDPIDIALGLQVPMSFVQKAKDEYEGAKANSIEQIG